MKRTVEFGLGTIPTAIAATAFAIALFGVSAAFAESAGEFAAVKGRVDVTRPGAAARMVSAGDPVEVGDVVRTKSLSRAEIVFRDGSLVRLAPGSRLEITEFLAGEQESRGVFKLFRGKVRSRVKKIMGSLFGRFQRNRFEVHTPTAVIGVRGTDFVVYHLENVSGAVFKEGTGYGYCLNNPDAVREIGAGEAMVVQDENTPPEVRPATAFELQWHLDDTDPEMELQEEMPPIMDDTVDDYTSSAEISSAETSSEEDGEPGEAVQQAEMAVREAGLSTLAIDQGPDRVFTEVEENESPSEPEDTDLPEPPPFLEIGGEIVGPSLSGAISGRVPGLVSLSGSYDEAPGSVWTAVSSGSLDEDGRFSGYAGGPGTSWDVWSQTLFIDGDGTAGFLSGTLYGSEGSGGGDFSGTGFMSITRMASEIGIEPEDLLENLVVRDGSDLSFGGSGEFEAGGFISAISGEENRACIEGQDWGVSVSEMAGGYSGATGDEFGFFLKDEDGMVRQYAAVDGYQWSSDGMRGRAAGSWVDLEDAVTGVAGGEFAGVYDPEKSTWNALTVGVWIETSRFLDMAGASPEDLEALNIPAVEIGRTDLTGTDGNMRIDMKDVTFFSYSTNDTPRIWATDAVSGTYGSDPAPGLTEVSLSGGAGDAVLDATFSVTDWDRNQWSAGVAGSGSVAGSSISIDGGAAGSYGQGSLSGTASGVASPGAGR